MDITLHLILAHFLADYPLQSDGMVAYKSKHFAGIVLHSLMHVLTSVLLGLPFVLQPNFWWAIGTMFVTHNVLDQGKVLIHRNFKKANRFLFYVLDQIGHMVVIVGSSWVWLRGLSPDFGGGWLRMYQDLSLVNFFLILILATYFYDVSRWTYRSSKKPQPYVRDWRMMGRNTLIVAVGFIVYWWSI
ncbi:DUF3307 domain-containing protein [Candidatus Peregrinibacteria bacterium]|nr:DUF3307 domain-containing protein [Candidatus Peregrinibacteria bacterium]